MADVKWIKICTDIFDDEKMVLLDSIPEHDAIIVVWFKLLCMAGKQNNGGIFMLNDRIAYTDEMLAAIFHRPINIVRLALTTFEKFGMIEIVNNAYTIPNWEKHQNIDGLEKIREQNRIRQAKFKEKQRLLESNVTDNVAVTQGNATDIDIDKKKKRKDIKNNNDVLCDDSSKPYKIIVDYLNEKASTSYRPNSKDTQKHINARLTDGYTVDDFKTVIDKMCLKWMGTEYEQYLRPATLFGTKFENYLNANIQNKGGVVNGCNQIKGDNKFADWEPQGGIL